MIIVIVMPLVGFQVVYLGHQTVEKGEGEEVVVAVAVLVGMQEETMLLIEVETRAGVGV